MKKDYDLDLIEYKLRKKYREVCDIFLDKCSQFIKEHGGAEHLREMQKDEEK